MPLSADATEIFRLHPECFNQETALLLEEYPDLFGKKHTCYVHSVEESQQLNTRKDPCVIIAASGMCEAGRILHHLKHNIEDPRNTVLIIGFQRPIPWAAGSWNINPRCASSTARGRCGPRWWS